MEEIQELIKTTLFLYLTKQINKTGKVRLMTYKEYQRYMINYNPDLAVWTKYDFDLVIDYLKEQYKHLPNLLLETNMTPTDEVIKDIKIRNALSISHILFVEQLIGMSDDALLKTRGIGPSALKVIDKSLAEAGYERVKND